MKVSAVTSVSEFGVSVKEAQPMRSDESGVAVEAPTTVLTLSSASGEVLFYIRGRIESVRNAFEDAFDGGLIEAAAARKEVAERVKGAAR